MNLFNAGFIINVNIRGRLFGLLNEVEQALRLESPYYLESYHYVGKPTMLKRCREERAEYVTRTGREIELFLDSGAFSAYTLGVPIDIAKYCDYCLQNADVFDHVSVLDLIDFSDLKAMTKGTYHNLMEMKRRGVEALPCFHYGEDPEVLDYYVANYPYITIGGMVPISTQQLTIWLDRLWAYHLTNADGTPKTKVHGFGLTSLPLMMRYPWYSVDSSTWVQWGSNGMILLPERGKQLDISARSSRRKIKDQHYDNMVREQVDVLDAEIMKYGCDPERFRELYYTRWVWNAWAFPKYVQLRGGGRQTYKAEWEGLFDDYEP